VFKVLDHHISYFLIAGSYKFFLLVYMNNDFGITILYVGAYSAFFLSSVLGWDLRSFLSSFIYHGWVMVVGGRRFFLDHLSCFDLHFLQEGWIIYYYAKFYIWDNVLLYTYVAFARVPLQELAIMCSIATTNLNFVIVVSEVSLQFRHNNCFNF